LLQVAPITPSNATPPLIKCLTGLVGAKANNALAAHTSPPSFSTTPPHCATQIKCLTGLVEAKANNTPFILLLTAPPHCATQIKCLTGLVEAKANNTPFILLLTAPPHCATQIKCLTGLVEAKVNNALAKEKPHSFDDWILRVMGEGIADIFMRPYNFKVVLNVIYYYILVQFQN